MLKNSESLGTAALVGEILQDVQKLIGNEIDLAKAELKQEGHKAKAVFFLLGSALALALVALVGLLMSFVFYLSTVHSLPLWGSFLIATTVFAVGAIGLGWAGRNKGKLISVLPSRTAESLKENVQWMRNRN